VIEGMDAPVNISVSFERNRLTYTRRRDPKRVWLADIDHPDAVEAPRRRAYDRGVRAPGMRRRRLGAEELARLAAAASEVFASEPDVVAVYLYGSAARGEPAADLDVAVLADRPIAPARLEALAAALQAHGAPDGPEIDLRPLAGSAPRFQFTVIREGRPLFERDPTLRAVREARIAGLWADFKPTWERMRRRMLERWRDG
jgi:predicted nucleotidyltransferase